MLVNNYYFPLQKTAISRRIESKLAKKIEEWKGSENLRKKAEEKVSLCYNSDTFSQMTKITIRIII